MSTAAKRRIAVGVIVALALWIPAHHVGTRLTHADPWKFFGWAMYAVPNATVSARADPMRNGEVIPRQLSPASLARLQTFAQRRAVRGRLARPDAMAADVIELEKIANIDGLKVRVRRWLVGVDDARWRYEDETWILPR